MGGRALLGLRSKTKCLMTLENSQAVVCGSVNLRTRFQQGFWNAGLGFQFGNFFRVKHGLGDTREIGAKCSTQRHGCRTPSHS